MAASNMADHVGRVLGDRYRVLAPLGSGASARVYLAEDVLLKRAVAVKVLHPSLADDPAFLKRFRAEAQAAAALSHPNVVTVYDWGEDDTPYLVTEALSGGSLRGVLDRGRLLTPSQALLVGLEAARGLDYAHRQGFVHRDIKPANLLFGREGRLRVADFGLARALAEAAWTEPAGVVLGTARYASPEQARGQALDGRSDVYSLALVLIEAVTGTVPFAADTTVATLMARLDTLMRVPAELGPLAPVIERAGRPDPTERPTASELARALIQTAERLPRPERLPLAPVVADLEELRARASSGPDATTIAAPARTGPPAAPATPAGPATPARRVAAGVVPSDDTTIGAPPVLAGAGGGGAASVLYDQGAEGPGGRGGAPRRRRHRRWPWVALFVLLLLAAGGVGAWALLVDRSTPTYVLPDLTTSTEGAAEALPQFAQDQLRLDTQYVQRDDTVAGQVLEQVPGPGEEVDEGTIVHIVVSQGPVPRLVPDLTKLSLDQAKAALQAVQLVLGAQDPAWNETEPVGTVLSSTLQGTQQPPGTAVDVVFSAGPAPRTMPVVAGLPLDQATAALAGVQLGIATTDAFSDDVPQGAVISADHAPGDQLARGTVVNVVVSKGPDLVKVPNLFGLGLDAAVGKLRDAGLVAGDVSGKAGAPVAITNPRADTSVKRGSTVDIVVG